MSRSRTIGRMPLRRSRRSKGWQEELSSHLFSSSFKPGREHPAEVYNEARDIMTSVHGGDYTSPGAESQLVWLQGELHATCAIQAQRL